MKNTKIMIAVIVTAIVTWLMITCIGYFVSDVSFKEVSRSSAVLLIMFLFGWIPSVIVGCDIDERLK